MRRAATVDRSLLARRALLATLVTSGVHLALLVPSGSAHAAVEVCVAGPTVGCINGTIRMAAGDPAVGISLEATGPDGEHTVTTGPDRTVDGRSPSPPPGATP